MGELTALSNLSGHYLDQQTWEDWYAIQEGTRTQMTQTFYSSPQPQHQAEQANLRGRVSYIQTVGSIAAKDIRHVTTYTYDIHGNVNTLWQDNLQYGISARMDYTYDLISGNVHELHYQPGKIDQFIHRYTYDVDNRLQTVRTSTDGYLWDQDANYAYYPHGPLAKKIIGQEKVQAQQYAYTLQGWLKGMNSGALMPQHDMGQDGLHGDDTARDAVGFVLGYNARDYTPIGSNVSFEPSYTAADLGSSKELWNGNIRSMITAIQPFMDNGIPMGYTYSYDQLHRLKTLTTYEHQSFANNSWLGSTPSQNYYSAFWYDANGNIASLFRNGTAANNVWLAMDAFTYHYLPNTNQLEYVSDPTPANNYTADIDNQTAGNYQYDAIGNLIQDNAENLDISWNVYGKVREINRQPAGQASPTRIKIGYDGLGNRVSKEIDESSGAVTDRKTDVYIRDGQGNLISLYEVSVFQNTPTTGTLGEVRTSTYLYGSERLGEYRNTISTLLAPSDNTFIRTRGQRKYELSTHLGNVLATVTDRKLPVDDTQGNIDHFEADVFTAQDYYAFGMGMPEREFMGEEFKFGFQGQERDNEIKGVGNNVNFKYRMHDPRVGRFFTVDPLAAEYAHNSPYAFSENRLLDGIELEGLEYHSVNEDESSGQEKSDNESELLINQQEYSLSTQDAFVDLERNIKQIEIQINKQKHNSKYYQIPSWTTSLHNEAGVLFIDEYTYDYLVSELGPKPGYTMKSANLPRSEHPPGSIEYDNEIAEWKWKRNQEMKKMNERKMGWEKAAYYRLTGEYMNVDTRKTTSSGGGGVTMGSAGQTRK